MGMKNKLNPCPFCGNGNIAVVVDNAYYSLGIANKDEEVHFKVICPVTSLGCGASTGWKYSKEEAIEDWNKEKEVKDNV